MKSVYEQQLEILHLILFSNNVQRINSYCKTAMGKDANPQITLKKE